MKDVSISFMYDRMLNQNQLTIEDPYNHHAQSIEEPKQKSKEVISKYYVLAEYNSKDEIDLLNVKDRYYKDITKIKTKLTNETEQLDKESKDYKFRRCQN